MNAPPPPDTGAPPVGGALTVADVARALNVHKNTVHALIHRGRLAAYRTGDGHPRGSRFRIEPSALEDYRRSAAVTASRHSPGRDDAGPGAPRTARRPRGADSPTRPDRNT